MINPPYNTILALLTDEYANVSELFVYAPSDVERRELTEIVTVHHAYHGAIATPAGQVALYTSPIGQEPPQDLGEHELWVANCAYCDTGLLEGHGCQYPSYEGEDPNGQICGSHPTADRPRPHLAKYRVMNERTGAIFVDDPESGLASGLRSRERQQARTAALSESSRSRASARRLRFNEYPSHGHMLVVSDEWNGVYWLADRHAVIRAGAVALEGHGRRLLEAPADDQGMVTFEFVHEHDISTIPKGTPIARAAERLTDPARIEEFLYPPYVPDATACPKRPYLQHPRGLTFKDAVVLDRDRRKIYWLFPDYTDIDYSQAFEASVRQDGPVVWGGTNVSALHPKWVLTALIDQSRSSSM